MKARLAAAAMLALLTADVSPAFATVRISDDRGGQIGDYLNKYRALRENGERVEIDGTCASACTMLLGVIPRNRICVTPRAVLAFTLRLDADVRRRTDQQRGQLLPVVELSARRA